MRTRAWKRRRRVRKTAPAASRTQRVPPWAADLIPPALSLVLSAFLAVAAYVFAGVAVEAITKTAEIVDLARLDAEKSDHEPLDPSWAWFGVTSAADLIPDPLESTPPAPDPTPTTSPGSPIRSFGAVGRTFPHMWARPCRGCGPSRHEPGEYGVADTYVRDPGSDGEPWHLTWAGAPWF